MVYLVGASSLNHAIKCIPCDQRRQLFGRNYSILGLSFNSNAVSKLKILQNLDRKRSTCQQVEYHDLCNIRALCTVTGWVAGFSKAL